MKFIKWSSYFSPIFSGKKSEAIIVADEYNAANRNGEMARVLQIAGITNEIRNVCPGAEKKIQEIENIKNRGDFNSRR